MQYQDASQAPLGSGSNAALPAAAPFDPNAGAPQAAPITKEQRDRLAQQGRELADARRQAAEANRRADAALQTSQALAERFRQQDQAGLQSYVNSLPPDQRAAAAVEIKHDAQIADLQRQIAASQPRPQHAPTALTPADIAARKEELRQQIAQETGIELTGNEIGVDDRNGEVAYVASLRAVALNTQQRGAPQQQTAGFPISARPMPGSAQVTTDALEAAAWRHTSKAPWKTRSTYSAMRNAAFQQAGIE